MKSTNQLKFKSIKVDPFTADEVHFRIPFAVNPYHQLVPRDELIKAWNAESRLRQQELEILYYETHDPRDELVQAPDTDTRADSN